MAMLDGERNARTKNRMPESGSSGSVRGEGSNALTYSEVQYMGFRDEGG